jgi:ABC-type phosphate transport system substrate-binding protein
MIAVSATAIALVGIGAGTALADPSSGTTPALTSIVGVGSDTVTPLFSGSPTENSAGSLVTDYNATSPSSDLWSWDAVNPSTGATGDTIVTKGSSSSDTTCSVARPNGSSAGITALNNGAKDGGDPCIDFARSSRGPNAVTSGVAPDAFVSLAKDAITWTYPVISGTTNPQPASLSVAQLTAIYNCTDTTWGEVNGTSDTTPVGAVLPQAGSGTRSTFLTALGLGSVSSEPCWINGVAPNGDAIEENTGEAPGDTDQFTADSTVNGVTIPPQDDVFPYSIGDWIAQGSPVTGTGTAGTPGGATVGGKSTSIFAHGNLATGSVPNTQNIVEAPVKTNTDGQPVINPLWNTTLNRTLYDVVRNGSTTAGDAAFPTSPSYEATALPAIFGPNGWACTSNTAQSDIVSYGFTSLGGNCGTLTPGD